MTKNAKQRVWAGHYRVVDPVTKRWIFVKATVFATNRIEAHNVLAAARQVEGRHYGTETCSFLPTEIFPQRGAL
jgi:hypothetical protein